MTIAHFAHLDGYALIGRSPKDLAEDYMCTDHDIADMLVEEYQVMERLLQTMTRNIPATVARNIAVGLLPAVITLCKNKGEMTRMIDTVIEWISLMGDVKTYLIQVSKERQNGLKPETSLNINISYNCDAVFDVQDKDSLVVSLITYEGEGDQDNYRYISNSPVIVGMYFIDKNEGDKTPENLPELIV